MTVQEGTPTGAADESPDQISQLKGEFARKTDAINTQLANIAAANAVLMEKLTSMQPAQKNNSPADEDLSALWYSDPSAAAKKIEEQTEARIMSKIDKKVEQQNKTAAVYAELHNDFPELNDPDAALTKKAGEIFARMPAEEQKSSTALKLAVKEAAMELGVKPRKQRSSEEFIESSSTGRAPRQKQDKIDPSTEFWAAELGVDLSDPATKARIAERAQRQWTKYQKPTPISSKKKGGK